MLALPFLVGVTLAALSQVEEAKPPIAANPAADLPCDLCFVRELHSIPEVDTWTSCEPTAFPEQSKRVALAWPALAEKVQPVVTPEVVRRLSRYSKFQMESYRKVSPLKELKLQPCTHRGDGAWIVFTAQVDSLPTHSPLVKRRLEVFVLYNAATEAIERVTIAVRGHVEE